MVGAEYAAATAPIARTPVGWRRLCNGSGLPCCRCGLVMVSRLLPPRASSRRRGTGGYGGWSCGWRRVQVRSLLTATGWLGVGTAADAVDTTTTQSSSGTYFLCVLLFQRPRVFVDEGVEE
eukprot:TRINITY_DN6601_c0_g1_i2.p1 TRINITY_DN6601_c0_g1~~TRINITY_DN6601_c0_g1_i2.p1  ORF type:complete len:121 (-),score=6.68 TRINITY_DN6601_c0_g1_i2:123-485(-)